jgi:hypothetical protein
MSREIVAAPMGGPPSSLRGETLIETSTFVTVTEQGLGLTKIDQEQCEQVLMNWR